MKSPVKNAQNGDQGWPGMAIVPYVEPAPPPLQIERRIRLTTISEIRQEMAKNYRDCRNGKLDSVQAGRLTYMLREIAVLIRDHQIEARLEAIEKVAKK